MAAGQKPLIYSYTFLQCYDDICPHQAYHRYILKDVPFVKTPEMEWGNQVHSAFEYRVGGGKPLPAAMQQWEPFAAAFDGKNAKTEMQIGLSSKATIVDYFKGQDIKYRCKIDLHIVSDNKAALFDYKTGGSKYEKPLELEIQAMFLKAKYPQLKQIAGHYIWLKENRIGQKYDLSSVRATWDWCEQTVAKIEADLKRGEFEKRRGGLCKGYCPVEDCEHWQPKQER